MQFCNKKHQYKLLFFSNFSSVYLDSIYPAKNQVAKDTKRYNSAFAVSSGSSKPNIEQATRYEMCFWWFLLF